MTMETPRNGRQRPAITTFDRWYGYIEDALNVVAAGSIMVLMVMAVIQVVGRKVFNAPIFGYIDWVEQIMILFAFIGVAYCQRHGGHVRMELIISNFRGRVLWAVEIFGVLIGLFIIGILIPTSFDHFLRAWELGDSTINAELPLWPAKLVIPVALTSLWLRLLLQLAGYLRLLFDPRLKPEAVPVILGVEEEAAKEIHDAFGDEAKVKS